MSKEAKKKKGFTRWLAVLALGLVTGAAAAAIFIAIKSSSVKKTGAMNSDVESEFDTTAKPSSDDGIKKEAENVSSSLKVSSSDVSEIVESVLPSVVSVECTIEASYSDIYGDLFGFDFGYGSPGQVIEGTSTGSGFIIGQNGNELLIATNSHVVEDAKSVSVEFIDGTKAEATVKGNDSYYDVAVLSVDLSKLSDDTVDKIKIATIGNSDEMQVGSMVVAIGNSLGYGQSVTVGYVSALNREVKSSDGRNAILMQTDAVINHGNSGGPLLNIYGEVIGITSSKYSSSVSNKTEGMCFSIPISKVVPIINELMNRVELSPSDVGYLGIEGKEVSDSYARVFGMPKGLYVYSVVKDSAADISGIKEGDIITSINGRAISSMDDLKKVLAYKKYDTEVEVTYSTMGRTGYDEKTITVKLGKKLVLDNSDIN